MTQYVCYLKRNHEKNTEAMTKKRVKYFKERRTTTHWPAPIRVNGLQPRTYGMTERTIDYEQLIEPKLDDLMDKIIKLL